MTEKKTGESIVKKLGAFNVLLLIVAFAACIIALEELALPVSLVRIAFQMIAIAFAFFYAVYGYKKNVARYYKEFLIVLGASRLVMVIVGIIEAKALGIGVGVSTVLFAVSFVLAAILAFAKDLGKTKSLCAVLAMLVLDVVNEVILLVKFGDAFSAVIVLAVSFVAVEFVFAKYADKAERGSK